MVDGANICSHEGQTILWMKADVEEVILIHFTEIDKVLNSELWDSSLQVYFISCSAHDTRQVFEF
jgi:hypothetical protein